MPPDVDEALWGKVRIQALHFALLRSRWGHSPSTWKSAASCIVEHFLHQEHLFLGFYGYRILTNRTWADCPVAGQTPILSLTVMQHIEQAGHTWYVVSCELMLFNAGERDLCSHSCALHVGTLACMIDVCTSCSFDFHAFFVSTWCTVVHGSNFVSVHCNRFPLFWARTF